MCWASSDLNFEPFLFTSFHSFPKLFRINVIPYMLFQVNQTNNGGKFQEILWKNWILLTFLWRKVNNLWGSVEITHIYTLFIKYFKWFYCCYVFLLLTFNNIYIIKLFECSNLNWNKCLEILSNCLYYFFIISDPIVYFYRFRLSICWVCRNFNFIFQHSVLLS